MLHKNVFNAFFNYLILIICVGKTLINVALNFVFYLLKII